MYWRLYCCYKIELYLVSCLCVPVSCFRSLSNSIHTSNGFVNGFWWIVLLLQMCLHIIISEKLFRIFYFRIRPMDEHFWISQYNKQIPFNICWCIPQKWRNALGFAICYRQTILSNKYNENWAYQLYMKSELKFTICELQCLAPFAFSYDSIVVSLQVAGNNEIVYLSSDLWNVNKNFHIQSNVYNKSITNFDVTKKILFLLTCYVHCNF